jgi:DNA-binding SARP family transcriptional activator
MLHETFWPDAPPAVASQGLRTTLCRLRRALALAAGSNADRYVRVGKSVALDLDWVSVDARTFRACLDLAAAEAAVGNRHAAREHYLQAERLYTGTLLASEALEATLAPSAAEYGELFEQLLAQLTEMQAPQRV